MNLKCSNLTSFSLSAWTRITYFMAAALLFFFLDVGMLEELSSSTGGPNTAGVIVVAFDTCVLCLSSIICCTSGRNPGPSRISFNSFRPDLFAGKG
ncbi:hypothetical protein DPMN_068410 [Dreissena polymorpha]|uniref:Uncharacterized protein n=1 Tax=Dreissena polymorpha TaxID=45954 RepID=A0A9D3Z1K2_DREPO|nr:hypothetical protein DPMN_068410 [Dreissena polymorpha]